MPDFSQNFNRYSYCLNNPLRYSDPSGEWIHLLIGAIIGGVINWGVHGFQFNAQGLAAFGIGALAGGVAAGTFGAGLGAMGVTGAGFWSLGTASSASLSSVAFAGLYSYTASTPFLTGGNNIAFGDPLPTPKEYLTGMALSVGTAVVVQGASHALAGRNIITGNPSEKSLIHAAQIESIAEGTNTPMPAADTIDDVLMERIGNRQVDNFLDSKTSGIRTDANLSLPDEVFASKAPLQVTPGTDKLSGFYVNDQGKLQPWNAKYDTYGRLIERTDFNAGNLKQNIPSTHYHTILYLPKGQFNGVNHIPGIGPNTTWNNPYLNFIKQ
jgi:YD repeat-containing protein